MNDQCRAFFLSVVFVAGHFLFLVRVSEAAAAIEEQLVPALISPSQYHQFTITTLLQILCLIMET